MYLNTGSENYYYILKRGRVRTRKDSRTAGSLEESRIVITQGGGVGMSCRHRCPDHVDTLGRERGCMRARGRAKEGKPCVVGGVVSSLTRQ